MKSREEKLRNQTLLSEDICAKANINLVTCGHCGSTLLHEINLEDIKCPFCDFEGEPCDFPDLFYTDFEKSAVYQESIEDEIKKSFDWCKMYATHDDIVRDKLIDLQEYFKKVTAFHSGGGCYHVLLQLEDGRLIIYHSEEATLEITFDKYESPDAYLKIDEDGRGLGWEYVAPDYYMRSQSIFEWGQTSIHSTIDRLIKYEYTPPKAVVVVEGGVITSVIGEYPVDVTIVDYDVQDDEGTIEIPQGDDKTAPANVWGWATDIDPKRVKEIMNLIK